MVNPQQYGHLLHDTFFALSHTILTNASPRPFTPKTAGEFGERDGDPRNSAGGGRAEREGGGGEWLSQLYKQFLRVVERWSEWSCGRVGEWVRQGAA